MLTTNSFGIKDKIQKQIKPFKPSAPKARQ
jgi:hypothetical protein